MELRQLVDSPAVVSVVAVVDCCSAGYSEDYDAAADDVVDSAGGAD